MYTYRERRFRVEQYNNDTTLFPDSIPGFYVFPICREIRRFLSHHVRETIPGKECVLHTIRVTRDGSESRARVRLIFEIDLPKRPAPVHGHHVDGEPDKYATAIAMLTARRIAVSARRRRRTVHRASRTNCMRTKTRA